MLTSNVEKVDKNWWVHFVIPKVSPNFLFIMHLLTLLIPCTFEQPSLEVLFKDQLIFSTCILFF